MAWWNSVWNWIKKAAKTVADAFSSGAKKLWNAIKQGAKTLVAATKHVLEVLKEGAKTLWLGLKILLNGIWYIIKSIANGVVTLVKKRNVVGLTVTLITAENCSLSKFNESQNVLGLIPEVIFWLENSNFTESNVPCDNILAAQGYAEDFLESCIVTEDVIYKDTAALIEHSHKYFQHVCVNQVYKMRISYEQPCGLVTRSHCAEKSKKSLIDIGLWSLDTNSESRRTTKNPELSQVCDTTQKVNKCTKKAMKSMGNCPMDNDRKVEDDLADSLDDFCNKHRSWDTEKNTIAAATGEHARAATTAKSKVSLVKITPLMASISCLLTVTFTVI